MGTEDDIPEPESMMMWGRIMKPAQVAVENYKQQNPGMEMEDAEAKATQPCSRNIKIS